jgi:CHAT domain-containing protein/tetratricopeptide (TPR) repeat protein
MWTNKIGALSSLFPAGTEPRCVSRYRDQSGYDKRSWRAVLTCLLHIILAMVTSGFVVEAAGSTNLPGHASTRIDGVQDPQFTSSPPQVIQLIPAQPLTFAIDPGQVRTFNLALTTGHSGRLTIKRDGINLLVSVSESNIYGLSGYGNPAGEFGPIVVWLSAQTAENYKLEVRPEDKWAVPGKFEIEFEEIQFPPGTEQNYLSAEQLVDQARQFQLQDTSTSRSAAIQKYEAALSLWKKLEEPYEQANTLHRLAQIYKSSGNVAIAEQYYLEALKLRRSANDISAQAYTLNDLGAAFRDLGRPERALETYQSARSLFQVSQNLRGEAAAIYGMGFVYARQQNMQSALPFYEAALAIYRTERNRYQEGRVLNANGGAYDVIGESAIALDYYQQALKIWKEVGDPAQAANTTSNIAKIYQDRGDWRTALDNYDAVLATYDSLPKRGETSILQKKIVTLDSIGFLYISLGDPQKALDIFQRALELCNESPQPWSSALTLARLGYATFLLRDPQTAMVYYEKSRQIREDSKDPLITETLTWMGMAQLALGNPQKALTLYTQALDRYEGLKSQNLQAQAATLDKIGEARTILGDYGLALESYRKALLLWRNIGDRNGETLTLFNLANAEFNQGHFLEANQQIESAVELVETLRSNTFNQQLRTSYFATKTNVYELDIAIKMRLSDLNSSQEFGVQALLTNERVRARGLVDTLTEARVDIRKGVNPQLIQLEKVLQERLGAKATQRIRILSTTKPSDAQRTSLTKEIQELSAKYSDTQALIRSESPHYAGLAQPRAPTVKQIQQELIDDQTLLLEYSLGDTRSYVWAVTPDLIKGVELKGRREIEATAEDMIKALTERNRRGKNESPQQWELHRARADAEYSKASAELSKMVLQPVALLLGNRRLVIVADGALQLVPFQALPAPNGVNPSEGSTANSKNSKKTGAANDARLLVEDHEIVYEASASVLAVQRKEFGSRQPARHALAVLADPVFDQEGLKRELGLRRAAKAREGQPPPDADSTRSLNDANAKSRSDLTRAIDDLGIGAISSLPQSREEAEAIMNVVPKGEGMAALGFDASLATVMRPDLSQYRIIHFATHGFADLNHPELSGIVLSLVDAKGQPQDGYLRLHEIYNLNLPADLVVLSACQTGVGKQIKGEGLIALTRGFIYAGAQRVVASLWKVDDEATRDLMEDFYKQMFINKLKPAAALRKAQINLSQKSQWRSPYYWAGFVLQGEWK